VTSLIPHARAIIKRRPRTAYGFVMAFLVSISLGFWHTALHERMEAGGEGGASGHSHDHAAPHPEGAP
jgi:hypothetical protein